MSARGSTPKTSSLSSMSPPLPAEPELPRVCTLTFILAFLAFVSIGGRLRRVLGRLGFFIFFRLRSVCSLSVGSSRGFRLGGSTGFLFGRDRCDFLVARERRHLVHCTLVDEAGRRMIFLRGFRLLREERRRIRCALMLRELDRVL